MGPRVIRLTLIVGVGFLIFQALLPISSFDLGYHLATGRFILHHLKIPETDPFAIFSPTGIWPLHQGISAVLIYGAYALFGFWGLKVFLLAVVALSAQCLLFSEKINSVSERDWIALFAISAMVLVFDRWELRPDFFSAFLLCLIALIFRRFERRGSRVELLMVFSVFLIWPSVHAGFAFGFLFLILWAVGYFMGEGRFPFSILFSGTLGALFGLLILGAYNSGGLYGLLEPFFFSKDPWFQNHIAEYRSLEIVSNRMYLWVLFLTVCFSFPLMRQWRQHLKWLLPAMVFMVFSLFIIRMKIYVIPFVFWLWVTCAKNKIMKEFFPPTFLVTLWLFLGLGIFSASQQKVLNNLDPIEIPQGAFQFLEREHLSGNIFNEDAWGGWLSFLFFPRTKVFVDNRLAVFGPEFYRDWYLGTLGGQRDPLVHMNLWKIDHVLVRTSFIPSTLQDSLMRSSQWSLDYLDDVAMVFSRRQVTGTTVSKNPGGKFALAMNSQDAHQVLPTLDYFLDMAPSVAAFELKSMALAHADKIQEAFLENERLLAFEPCHLPGLFRKAANFRAQGKSKESAKVLAQGLGCRGPQVAFLSALAKLQYDEGYVLKPKRVIRIIRKFWPQLPELVQLEKGISI